MKTKIILIIIIVLSAFIIGMIFFLKDNSPKETSNQPLNNVSVVDGKQIISITAKGGYFPRITNAKADIPTTIKLNTKATFDCSSAIVIPGINYRSYLPPSGETIIDIPPQKAGSSMNGTCSMGMYGFVINFN